MNAQETITHQNTLNIKFTARKSRPQPELETIAHAVQVYGFLVPKGETIPLTQFADMIKARYDPTQPRIAEIARVLSIPAPCSHLRQSSNASGTICLDCRKVWTV